MQVSTLLLSCQSWLMLQLLRQPVAGSGEALRLSLPGSPGLSLGTARGHVHLQTTFDSGCEPLPALSQSAGCVRHRSDSSLWLHRQSLVLPLQ